MIAQGLLEHLPHEGDGYKLDAMTRTYRHHCID